MTFLTPWSALAAGAVAVPLLLLLYVLKLRRRTLRLPSTLLWRRATEDLQANVPFQRLRASLLLFLQLLLMAAILLALARPVVQADRSAASSLVILIDRSASMSARDMPGDGDQPITRLDAAKAAAREIVSRIGRGDELGQAMVIAFGASPQVVSTFQSQRQALLDAVDSIEPTDEQANLDAALKLAAAFTGRSASEDVPQAAPDVVLISDGGVAPPNDAAGFVLRAGAFRFVSIAPPANRSVDNLGIASFSARRDYEDPAHVLVFTRLTNAGGPVDTTITLRLDGAAVESRELRIPAASDAGPGESSTTFTLELPGGGVLDLLQNRHDALGSDDQAALVLPPPQRPRIALVYSGEAPDPFVFELAQQLEPRALRELTPQLFESLSAESIDSGSEFDLVIFDRVRGRLPGVPSLTIGAAPIGIDTIPPSTAGGRRMLSWDREHPIMRHVSLDTLVFSDFGAYVLPAGARSLALGPDGPVLASLNMRGARHVLVGFELRKSNWPTHVSIVVFMQNVMDFLTLSESGQAGRQHRPGEPITVRAAPGASAIEITGPASAHVDLAASNGAADGALATLPILRRAGLYAVTGAADVDRIAVCVLSDVESDIRPRASITVNARPTEAGTVGAAAPMELWPWLVAAGLALLVVEWLVYLSRARG